MRKLTNLLIIVIIIVITVSCSSSGIKILDKSQTNMFETSRLNHSDEYKISKEIMTAKYVESTSYENKKVIEYVTTKEYLYSVDGSLLDNKYSVKGTVFIYDKDGNIKEERLLSKEKDEGKGYEKVEYYIKHMDNIVEHYKNPDNTVIGEGEQTVNEKGQIIEEKIVRENGSTYYLKYEYDEKDRIIKKTFDYENGPYETIIFTYDDKDRIIKVNWNGFLLGRSVTHYSYNEDNLLLTYSND